MKLLHTSDWHVGKPIRGRSRADEHAAVLAEIAEVADAEAVDLVLVVGDLFDAAAPPPEAERIVYSSLVTLSAGGQRPVVVVAGNHDHARPAGRRRPGLRSPRRPHPRQAARGRMTAGCCRSLLRAVSPAWRLLPFPSQRGVVTAEQLMTKDAGDHGGAYAERVKRILDSLAAGFADDAVNVVLAHLMVMGGTMGGGERGAHTIFDYWVPAAAFPATAHYAALGHLHRAQAIDGPCPLHYCGSPLQLDFGETANAPQVNVVSAVPGKPGVDVRPVLLSAGRRLRVLRGTPEQLESVDVDDFGDDHLKLVVVSPPVPGLADSLRERFPNAVEVVLAAHDDDERRGGSAAETPTRIGRSPQELFASYLEEASAPDDDVQRLFAELVDELVTRMKPVRLELEGFTAFRNRTTVEFEGADLFALCGPTGAGKTSLIDAMTFALYGSVPRLDEGRVAPVISQGLAEARIRFDFTVGGEPYVAVRVVRGTKAGGATTKEARLETGDGTVLAGDAKALTTAVTDLLGLDFKQFTTCVSLPQGEFARFLHAEPRHRQDLLVRLLDLGLYEKVGQAARQRAAAGRAGGGARLGPAGEARRRHAPGRCCRCGAGGGPGVAARRGGRGRARARRCS